MNQRDPTSTRRRPARRRQGRAAHRRHPESHRRGAIRRRSALPGNAARRGAAQPASARAHRRASTRAPPRRMPGVKAVVTGADTAQRKWGCFRPDLYPLAIDKVRYVGDEVAAVAAMDPETARAAVDRIDVQYEVLPAVLSLDAALAPGRAAGARRRARQRRASVRVRARRRRRGIQGERRRRRRHLGIRAPVAHLARDHRLRRAAGPATASRCGATRRRRFSRAAAMRSRSACRKARCA